MHNKLINLAKKSNIDLEINESKTESVDIGVLNKKEKHYQVTKVKSYLIKAIKDNKCVKLEVESLKNPEKIISNIKTILDIQDNDNKNYLSKGNISKLNKDKDVTNYNKVSKDLRNLYELKDKYPNLANLELEYEYANNSITIKNASSNLKSSDYYHVFAAGVSVNDKEKSKASYITYFAKNYDFNGFKEEIITSLEGLKYKLNSTSLKTDRYNIIIKNNIVADILAAFVSMFYTKNIMQNESILVDKFNKKVFSDKISIVEEPFSESAIYRKYFDTEGTKTTTKKIIDNGVFIKKLNNIEYAIKSNESETGNASGVFNMHIVSGNNTYDELIKELDNGIIIDEAMGLHSGIDVKSGNISIPVSGYLVENGVITKGVDMIVLSTNIFESLSNVISVGNDMSHSRIDVLSPSLLLSNIAIAGGEQDE